MENPRRCSFTIREPAGAKLRILGRRWREGFLDEARLPGTCRVRVQTWHNLERLENLHFVKERRLRLLWNYLREIGPLGVVRRVRSRLAETLRNDKYCSCGVGEIIEADPSSTLRPGDMVVFVAPAHARCAERVVVPHELVSPAPPLAQSQKGVIQYYSTDDAPSERWWQRIAGWSSFSGMPLDHDQCLKLLEQAKSLLRDRLEKAPTTSFPVDPASPIRERTGDRVEMVACSQSRSAVLFGYGNYAKTTILPFVSKGLRVACIHELDPTQAGPRVGERGIRFDTCPWPRSGEKYNVYLIAGFHHTHGPLAVQALQQDAYAVVEKPIVTEREQLEELLRALRLTGPRLFSCFHKRYSPFNEWVRTDLNVTAEGPISYHAVVYEVPLPALHWYRWPNSRSRIVSNACHWIDHFLFLNEFCPPVTLDVWVAQNGTVNLSAELTNGATFTMSLTDRGSGRLGLREYVELRSEHATVRMMDGRAYSAENEERIIRRRSRSKMKPYAAMYRRIADSVRRHESGDSIESIEISAKTILDFEHRFQEVVRSTRAYPW